MINTILIMTCVILYIAIFAFDIFQKQYLDDWIMNKHLEKLGTTQIRERGYMYMNSMYKREDSEQAQDIYKRIYNIFQIYASTLEKNNDKNTNIYIEIIDKNNVEAIDLYCIQIKDRINKIFLRKLIGEADMVIQDCEKIYLEGHEKENDLMPGSYIQIKLEYGQKVVGKLLLYSNRRMIDENSIRKLRDNLVISRTILAGYIEKQSSLQKNNMVEKNSNHQSQNQ